MKESNVLIRYYIGNEHIQDKAVDPSGFGSWSNTLEFICEEMAKRGLTVSAEEAKRNIHQNNGFEYSHSYTDRPCQQERFEIHRTGNALT